VTPRIEPGSAGADDEEGPIAMLEPEQLLERLSTTLRRQIGPAVAEPFPRTQAFMASVILEKLARQLRTAAADAEADRADRRKLDEDLRALAGPNPPPRLAAALAGATGAPDAEAGAALAAIVDALYAERDQLGAERFDQLLGRVRRTLRARLDRQVAYAA
jgi:hypothetical protein